MVGRPEASIFRSAISVSRLAPTTTASSTCRFPTGARFAPTITASNSCRFPAGANPSSEWSGFGVSMTRMRRAFRTTCSLVMMYPEASTMTPEPTTRQDLRLAASSPLACAEAHQAETCTCTTAGATVAANRSNAPLNWVSPFVLSSAAADAHATRKIKIRNRRTSPPRIYRFQSAVAVRGRHAAVVLRS
jgi:hypothetical protein